MSYLDSIIYLANKTILSWARIDISGGEAVSADIFSAALVSVSVDYRST